MNKKFGKLTFAFMLATVLISFAASAQGTSSSSIASSGSIYYAPAPTPSPTPSPTPPPDDGTAYILSLIANYPNLASPMSQWHGSNWDSSGGLPVWYWNDDSVRTPDGDITWHGIPWSSGHTNTHRELLDGMVTAYTGDLVVEVLWCRTGPATKSVSGNPSTTIGVCYDMYPISGTAPDTSIGQVREHNCDARYSSGEWYGHYLCDIDPTWSAIGKGLQYNPRNMMPLNSIALYPETDGWVRLVLTEIIPSWNPDLVNYNGGQGAYEIRTYYGHGWSPVQPGRIIPDFIGAWFGWDYGCEIWLGGATFHVIPAGQYDPDLIGGFI
jgi:hypothetical protein